MVSVKQLTLNQLTLMISNSGVSKRCFVEAISKEGYLQEVAWGVVVAEATHQDNKLNVFISYSRDDLGFSDQLDAALGVTGF